MMTSFSDSRHRYEDRWDTMDGSRYGGRTYDLRGWDGPSRRLTGDWMRPHPWTLREWDLDERTGLNVIDVTAHSPQSWEDAARRAIADASRMVGGIRTLWIEGLQVAMDDELGLVYRIHARISFRERR